MSESSGSTHAAQDYRSPHAAGGPPKLLRLGGAMGLAASFIGLTIFFVACAGFDAAFKGMSLIPVLLGLAGLILTVVGAITEKDRIAEDTHVLAAAFGCICGIIGGAVEMAIWFNVRLFA